MNLTLLLTCSLLVCSFHCYSFILLLISCLRIYLIYFYPLLLFIYLIGFCSFGYFFISFSYLFVCLSVYCYVLFDVYICHSYSLIRYYLLASLVFIHLSIYLIFGIFLFSNLLIHDSRGWQFLTIEAAETLCMVCVAQEEHIFRKIYI